MCSFRQIRSFASPMHNNGTFQYFAISGGTSRAALHGSEVIKQAVFVNDALRAIMQLYKNKSNIIYLYICLFPGDDV